MNWAQLWGWGAAGKERRDPQGKPTHQHSLNKAIGCQRTCSKSSSTSKGSYLARSLRSLWRRKWQPNPVFFPGKSHGRRSLVGLQSMGSQRVGHDWATSLLRSLGFSCFLLTTAIQNTPRPPPRGLWRSSPVESNPPSLCKVFQQRLNAWGCELLPFYVSIPPSKVWFYFVFHGLCLISIP